MAGGREAIITDVYEAATSRRAVRGFKDEPVSREVLERVLSAAAWSPSGSNIQPWNTYLLTGAPLAELKTRAVERVCHGDPRDVLLRLRALTRRPASGAWLANRELGIGARANQR
jgi:nitroreductase